MVALSRGLHCVPRHVVERDHVGQDAHRLIEGTEPEEIDTEQSVRVKCTGNTQQWSLTSSPHLFELRV